jgi:hypothetical protein
MAISCGMNSKRKINSEVIQSLTCEDLLGEPLIVSKGLKFWTNMKYTKAPRKMMPWYRMSLQKMLKSKQHKWYRVSWMQRQITAFEAMSVERNAPDMRNVCWHDFPEHSAAGCLLGGSLHS